MHEEDRIPALRDILGRVAMFATILSPDGISVRILNYDEDTGGRWDNLKTVDEIERRMRQVNYVGDTRLGSLLWSKVVMPMILDKAQRRTLKKPVIVVIITDGEASLMPGTPLSKRCH